MDDEANEGLFSVQRAATYLGISTQTLYRRHPEIPRIRIGSLIRFQRSDLDQNIDKNRFVKTEL